MLDSLKKIIPGSKVALRLTDFELQIVQVAGDIDSPELSNVIVLDLPQGCVVNGLIAKEKALAELINNAKKDPSNKIDFDHAYVVLPESQTYEQVFTVPSALKGDELETAIKAKVAERIPLASYEVKFEYRVVEEGDVKSVYVVAARREVIAQYYEVLKSLCDITPIVLEPESISVFRNIPLNTNAVQNFILCDVKDYKLVVTVFNKGRVSDSFVLQGEDSKVEKSEIIEELKSIITHYLDDLKIELTHILISGTQLKRSGLKSLIDDEISIPVAVVEKYKVEPQATGRNTHEFRELGGMAAFILGDEAGEKINLFKKVELREGSNAKTTGKKIA